MCRAGAPSRAGTARLGSVGRGRGASASSHPPDSPGELRATSGASLWLPDCITSGTNVPAAGVRGRSQQPPALAPGRDGSPQRGSCPAVGGWGSPLHWGKPWAGGCPAHTCRALTYRWIKSAGLMKKSEMNLSGQGWGDGSASELCGATLRCW